MFYGVFYLTKRVGIVQKMNNIRNRVTEIVIAEIIMA